MQQYLQDDSEDNDSGRLPAIAENRKEHSLAFARNHQLSLDLRASDSQAEADDIDLLSYWRILIKRRWLVLGVLLLVLAISFVGTLLTTPVYRASAVMDIERNTLQVVNVQGGANTMEDNSDEDFYQTQYELLKSRSLAQRVASEMGLAEGDQLERLSPSSPWSKLWSLFSGSDVQKNASSRIPSATAATDASIIQRQRWATGVIQGGLSVQPVPNSRLVRINFDSLDSSFAQRAANAVADSFIAANLEHRLDSSSYAKGYLEDRLQEMKLKLEDSERKLVEVGQKEQIVGIGDQGDTLSEQNLASLNAALSQAHADRIRAEARWNQARASSGVSLMIDDKSNSIIKSLQETQSQMQVRLERVAGQYMQLFEHSPVAMMIGRSGRDSLNSWTSSSP